MRPDQLTQLRALAQPARLSMVERLLNNGGEINATDLGSGLDVSQPTISRHLHVLVESGILARRRRGQEALFCIDDDRVRRLGQQLVALGNALAAGGDRQERTTDVRRQRRRQSPTG